MDFYYAWRNVIEIVSYSVISTSGDPVVVGNWTQEMYKNCKFYLSKESGGLGDIYWISAIDENGIEISRDNTNFVVSIYWDEKNARDDD